MRKLTLVCAALAIVATLVSVRLWRELRVQRELVATLQAPTPTAELWPDPAPPGQPAGPAPQPDTGGQAAVPLARSSNPVPDIDRMLDHTAALARDPEYREASAARLRMNIPQDYPGLVEELRLTAEEADRLFDLLAAFQSEKIAVSVGAPITGQPGDPSNVAAIEELMRTRQTLNRRRDESLAALLGNARHEQFRIHEERKPARNRVMAFGRTLASAGQPLSDAQVLALTVVFVADEMRKREFSQQLAGARQPGEAVDQMRIDEANLEFQTQNNRRLLEAMQPHLNAAQLESWRAMLDQQLTQSRAELRVRRERSGGPVPQQAPQDFSGR